MTDPRLKIIAVGIFFVICSIMIVLWFNQGAQMHWKPAAQTHNFVANDHFEEMWVMLAYIDCPTCLIAHDNKVFLAGSLERGGMHLIVLDILTGRRIVEQPLDRRVSNMVVNSNQVYIGLKGTDKIGSEQQVWGASKVAAHDIETGKEIWSNHIPGSNNIILLTVEQDFVYAVGNRYHNLVVLNTKTGQEINPTTERITLANEAEIEFGYQPQGYLLSAFRKNTNEMLWQDKIRFYLFAIDNNIFLVKDPNGEIGMVTAIDGLSGRTLWEYSGIVSNIANDGGVAYFIILEPGSSWGGDSAENAQLVAIDIRTGKMLGSVNFEPPGIQSGWGNYHYHVAASNDIVLVYLGDSRQLFAFRYLGGDE